MVKIAQYNVQSLKTNKKFLEVFINTQHIDICVLSEIFRVDETKDYSKLLNYNIIFKTRADNAQSRAIGGNKKVEASSQTCKKKILLQIK